MSRRKHAVKRDYLPDPKYGRVEITRFINHIMRKGKKSVAQNIFYGAMEIISKKTKEDPVKVFDKAIENVTPKMEVRPRRVGGATYQVPFEVRPERGFSLACRWIIESAKAKKGKAMEEKLAEEFIAATNKEGEAYKKKENSHKMAEANKAFAHFAWGKR